MHVTSDLTANEKQKGFFLKVMEEVAAFEKHKKRVENWQKNKKGPRPKQTDPIRYFFYGGAIRGGKTYVCLTILVILCLKYSRIRCHVIRRSFPDLLNTAVKSLEKIVDGADVRWKRSQSEYFCEFPNGSRIYFMAEGYTTDKDLNRFKGLETNIALLEQIEELQEETYNKTLERVGSWYAKDQPPGMVFATFNPTFNWVKKRFHDNWIKNGCLPPFYYTQALPDDNPLVTEDQWMAWDQMDDKYKARYIEGKWEVEIEGAFMHQFDTSKHVDHSIGFKEGSPVWLSFDFNHDPMTCLVTLTDYTSYFHTVKEFRIANSDTYELCAKIKEFMPVEVMDVKITGDATGQNAMAGARGAINHYQIIKQELGVPWENFMLPTVNPYISDSRTFCNSFMKSFPNVKIHPSCEHLIQDLRFVLIGHDARGKMQIQKTGQNKFASMDNAQLGHLLDCYRYQMHNAFPDYIKIHRS